MDAKRQPEISDYARSQTIEERKTSITLIHWQKKKLKLKWRHNNNDNTTQQLRGDSCQHKEKQQQSAKEGKDSHQKKEKQQQQSAKAKRDSGCTNLDSESNITSEHGNDLYPRDSAEHCVESETDKDTDNDFKLVESAYQYITDKMYPPESTKNEKCSIRLKDEKLVVVNEGWKWGNPRCW